MKNDLHDMQAGKDMQYGIYPHDPEESNAPKPSGDNDVSTLLVANIMNQLMRPMLESIGKLLKNNTEAMEQIASSQDVIRNRIEALEKQVRLNTPVTDKQARYLADAARNRSKELIGKEWAADGKAVTKLSGAIKKAVLSRYGVGSLREIPRCEYEVAMKQIEIWNKPMILFEITEEARERLEATKGE